MDGLALLTEINELRPGTPTPLITGHGEHDLAVQALRGGLRLRPETDRPRLLRRLARPRGPDAPTRPAGPPAARRTRAPCAGAPARGPRRLPGRRDGDRPLLEPGCAGDHRSRGRQHHRRSRSRCDSALGRDRTEVPIATEPGPEAFLEDAPTRDRRPRAGSRSRASSSRTASSTRSATSPRSGRSTSSRATSSPPCRTSCGPRSRRSTAARGRCSGATSARRRGPGSSPRGRRAGVGRLTRIVGDILLASQIDAGRLRLKEQELDIAGVVRTVVEGIEAALTGNERISLELSAPDSLPPVSGDEDKLRQVLLNLIDNAIKYSPDGGRVHVRVEQRDSGLRIAVSDEGLGIPHGEEQRIFGKFYRVDPQQTRGVGGTGLGLYICRELVRHMEGRVSVTSREGRARRSSSTCRCSRSARASRSSSRSPRKRVQAVSPSPGPTPRAC